MPLFPVDARRCGTALALHGINKEFTMKTKTNVKAGIIIHNGQAQGDDQVFV